MDQFYASAGFAMVQAQQGCLRKFQCGYCLRVLSSRQNYKEHLYIHTGEKPFKCAEPGCTESFRQGSQLSVHRKIHRQVQILQTRTSIQIPKVTSIQLTDLLDLERQRAEIELRKGKSGPETTVLPRIGEGMVQGTKLPTSIFFME